MIVNINEISKNMGNYLFKFIVFVVIFFLIFPAIISLIVSFNTSGFNLPPKGFTLEWYIKLLNNRSFIDAIYVSLIVAVASSTVATLIGFMTSYAISRFDFKFKHVLNIFSMSPLVFPATVLGLALYIFLVGLKVIQVEGPLPLIIGHTVLLMPYSIRIILASLQHFDNSLEEAAINMGANLILTFIYITLPIIKTGIIASILMCFILSWNNFALSLFLASPGWFPIPLEVYSYIKFEFDSVSAALISCMIVFSLIFVILIDRQIGLTVALGGEKK